MPKTTAKVCQINGTNYVTYKGVRYTVKDYNKKFKTRVHIPKNVKVCETEMSEFQKIRKEEGYTDDLAYAPIPQLRKVEEPNMKNKKEQLKIGNIIRVRYGYEYNKAKIIGILPNGERIFRLTGLYFTIVDKLEDRVWWFVKEKSYFWEITLALLIGTLLVIAY